MHQATDYTHTYTSEQTHSATGAVIDDAYTVFDDGAVLLFGKLSSLSLTMRVPGFFRCMCTVDDREQATLLCRYIHSACSKPAVKFFFDF